MINWLFTKSNRKNELKHQDITGEMWFGVDKI
jgi:hypothetical protein